MRRGVEFTDCEPESKLEQPQQPQEPKPEQTQDNTGKPPTKRRRVYRHKIAELKRDMGLDAVEHLAKNVTLDDPRRSAMEFGADALPDWFPELYKPARAVEASVDLSERRQLEVGTATELRIPQRTLLTLRANRLPLSAFFVNSWADLNKPENKGKPGNIAVALRTWLKVRPFLLRWLDNSPLAEGVGFVARQWRAFLKGHVDEGNKKEMLKRLGLMVLFERTEAAPMT